MSCALAWGGEKASPRRLAAGCSICRAAIARSTQVMLLKCTRTIHHSKDPKQAGLGLRHSWAFLLRQPALQAGIKRGSAMPTSSHWCVGTQHAWGPCSRAQHHRPLRMHIGRTKHKQALPDS